MLTSFALCSPADTVLRYAADIYTDLVLLFAKSINPASPTLFKSQLSPFARSRKSKQLSTAVPADEEDEEEVDTTPKKLTWHLTGEIRMGIRFAETRLSDLICQHEVEALEFAGYGKEFSACFPFGRSSTPSARGG